MVWTNVNNMTVAEISGTISVSNESVGSNTGTPILCAAITKTETEWGGLAPYLSVKNNSHSILQIAHTYLQGLYPNKEIDLSGIHIKETNS